MSSRTSSPIVKIGGSLLGSDQLAAMLAVAAAHDAVIVPGGGPFADAVRAEQRRLGFSDRAAHALAIRAMDQSAVLLAEFASMQELRTTRDDFDRHAGGIWAASHLALDADLPSSWDVTSDSLALWLAIELQAPRLVLLKSCAAPDGSYEDWAHAGVVDRHFPILARKFVGDIACVAPASSAALEAALTAPRRIAA